MSAFGQLLTFYPAHDISLHPRITTACLCCSHVERVILGASTLGISTGFTASCGILIVEHVKLTALGELHGLVVVIHHYTIDDDAVTHFQIIGACELGASKAKASIDLKLVCSGAVVGDVIGGVAEAASVYLINLGDDALGVDLG